MPLTAPQLELDSPAALSEAPLSDAPRARSSAGSARVAWAHVVLGLLGVAVSLYSVKLHNIVKAGGSACDISASISCDKVLGSAWAAPFGIPIGLPGAFFFGLVIFTAISTSANANARAEAQTRLALASLGLCGALGLLFISKVLIGSWCPVCLATHSVVLLNFGFALWGWRRTR